MINFWASACEKGEQWQQALDLVVAEQSVELLPHVITCNASPGEQLLPRGMTGSGKWKMNTKTAELHDACDGEILGCP